MIDYSVYLTGNPMDEEAPEKAYARAQMKESMTFDKFVKHIADHNGVFSRECLVEMLLNGNKVQLGALGDFWISLSSKAADSLADFTAANITGINVIFTPGSDFADLISRAQFNPVASRVAQAATLKAEKAGEATVDLEAAKRKPAASEPGV